MRQPNLLDSFYDYARLDKGKRPDGRILLIDEDEDMIVVSYPKAIIEYRTDQCVRVNGILHHRNFLSSNPEVLYQGDDEQTYWYGEYEWSSHDGGHGRWEYHATSYVSELPDLT